MNKLKYIKINYYKVITNNKNTTNIIRNNNINFQLLVT